MLKLLTQVKMNVYVVSLFSLFYHSNKFSELLHYRSSYTFAYSLRNIRKPYQSISVSKITSSIYFCFIDSSSLHNIAEGIYMIHILILIAIILTILANLVLPAAAPVIGLIANTISISVYLILAAFDVYDFYAQEVLSLSATLMVITIINVYLHFSDVFLNSLFVYVMLLFISLVFCLKIFHEKSFFSVKNLKKIYIIFPVGILLALAVSYFIHFTTFSVQQVPIFLIFLFLFIAAIAESIFFQALIQNAVISMTESIIAIGFTTILFGIFHFSNHFIYVGLYLLLGLAYSLLYTVWKNIYIIIGLNLIINLTYYLLTTNLLVFALR